MNETLKRLVEAEALKHATSEGDNGNAVISFEKKIEERNL